MNRQTIATSDAPAAIGPYSQAIRTGDTLWMSGQIPLDPKTMQIVEGGIEAGEIERVEVSTDDGQSFADAQLDEPVSRAAWRGWRFHWDAPPGEHVLCSRASDAAGNVQPLDPPWNRGGYANNAVERVTVCVSRP